MNIHEFQAKELLSKFGVEVPAGVLAETPQAAREGAEQLGGRSWVVKAQVHAGGRGRAGGVKTADSSEEVAEAARNLLRSRLVTDQTTELGRPVNSVLVEQACDIERELYLAILVDRALGRIALLASSQGGQDVEAQTADVAVERMAVEPGGEPQQADALDLAARLGLSGSAAESAAQVALALYQAFVAYDASLIEVNPLAVTKDGRILAVDVKMVLDDNALFRHPELESLRDDGQEDSQELEAKRYELNFVTLEGEIGCVVNGAGLGLATVDMLHDLGGRPANFMDIRPVATREQVATGFGMILANPRVRAIFVNIYGGGVLRCDTIAEGVALACRRRGLAVPLIVRAAGTNSDICRNILVGQGIAAQFADSIESAAAMAVRAAAQGAT